MIAARILNPYRSAFLSRQRAVAAVTVRTTTDRHFSDFNKLYGPFVNGDFEFPEHLKSNTFAVTSPSTSGHLCDVISADKEYVDRAGDLNDKL